MKSNEFKTPFARLVVGICAGSLGQILAFVVPTALLLTIKLAMLDPAHVTKNFSIASLVSAIATIIGQYLAGFISDRTSWKLGRRRPWILIGSVLGAFLLYGVGQRIPLQRFVFIGVWLHLCLMWKRVYSLP